MVEFIDNDVSATRGTKRPGYEDLLARIEAGDVDAVVVWALDRLHRRPIELEHFITLVERHRVALANVAGDVDLDFQREILDGAFADGVPPTTPQPHRPTSTRTLRHDQVLTDETGAALRPIPSPALQVQGVSGD